MNSASTSTASLLPSKQSPSSKKDYQKAFGKLSSSLGFGGSILPVPVSPPNASSRASSQPSATAAQRSQAAYWTSQSHKNFGAAFGDLSGMYGFAGNVPSSNSKKI